MTSDLARQLEQTASALRESGDRLAEVIAAFEALDAGIVYYDAGDRLVFCNARFREMYRELEPVLQPGTSYDEIARQFVRSGLAIHQDWAEDTYVAWLKERHRDPDPAGYEVRRRGGQWLLISDHRTAAGGVIGLRVDITQRKAVEAALAESERRFRSLLEMSSDWYWEQDAEFRFTFLSDGLFRQVGENPGARLGKLRWELPLMGVSEESWAEHRCQLDAHQPFRNFEYQWVAPDGRRFDISVSGDPVFDPAGRFVGYRGTGTDITQRKSYEARIKELAEYDFLTGLPNRALLNARFAQAERQARRSGQALALLFIDLDRFKNINDSLGHSVGDQLLAETAQRLRQLVRTTDTVSRHGGDEFLILLADIGDPANAGRIAEQMLVELARPYRLGGHELIVTPSIGITVWPTDAEELPELVRQADMAMYHSKSMGRNQYSFFKEEMNTRVHERLALENALRRAIQNDEFHLDYQPVFDLRTRRITSAEALLRWTHPELGLISPTRFIPIAEDTGLIMPIGDLVIQKVCERKESLAASPHAWLPIAINLSAIQLRDRHLLDVLPARFKQHGLKPGALELEITESLLLSESESAASMLQSLRLEGMRLVIDDFGTGYSNLGFLRRFAIDKLKIDQSFIRDIPADYNAMALARGIIGLARSIGLRTVAEGIETQAQLDFLIDAGCDEGQGYLLARPESCDKLIERLEAQLDADRTRSMRLKFLNQLKGS
ncbi:MAG: EAL domain-containing protein [Burkholderiales bacterium]|nr:EAL domain-containing protein [Burkholderiales bacterium]